MSEKAASEATTKSYDYLEPPAALGEITNASLKEQRAVLSDSTGLTLEIQFLQNFGWSLELRCDLLDTSIRRQPITAQQDSLERGKLGLNSSESTVSLSCGVHRLEVARTDGALKVFNAEQIVFSTEAHPFRRHQHAIEIYESIVL